MKALPALFLAASTGSLLAQGGDLDPSPANGAVDVSGNPQPSMKSLDIVEARTPISGRTTITEPGSYYLTQNITSTGGQTILIQSSDVTVDLNGFTVIGPNSTFSAIWVNGINDGPHENVKIHNGVVKGPAFGGVTFSNVSNLVLEDLRISGTNAHGIGDFNDTFDNTEVAIRRCHIGECGTDAGIELSSTRKFTIEDCTVRNAPASGILVDRSAASSSLSARVSGCRVTGSQGNEAPQNPGDGTGLYFIFGIGGEGDVLVESSQFEGNAGSGVSFFSFNSRARASVTLVDCSLEGNQGLHGFSTFFDGAVLTRCRATRNSVSQSVISAGPGCTMIDCVVDGNEGRAAIFAGSGSVLRGCSARNNTLDEAAISATGTIENCIASRNTMTGASATAISAGEGSSLINCAAISNTHEGETSGAGIGVGNGSVVRNCTANFNLSNATDSYGIRVGNGCTIEGCAVKQNGVPFDGTQTAGSGIGISAGRGCILIGCSADNNLGDGIVVAFGCLVSNNTCTANGNETSLGAGIRATGDDNRIEGNHVTGNRRGIFVEGTENLIIRNSAIDNPSSTNNGANYAIVPSNQVGPIVSSPVSATNPWSNFSN